MAASRRLTTSRVLAAVIVLAGAVAAVIIVLTAPSGAEPRRVMESRFQDDDHLIYAPSSTVARTLDTLRGLGVQRIRATVLWRAIAPDPSATAAPAGFDPGNPADYPPAAWVPYDRLIRMARARGIDVDFNVGRPARGGRWPAALGRRYSGRYGAGDGSSLPRVDYWSIWNEPNQPGW